MTKVVNDPPKAACCHYLHRDSAGRGCITSLHNGRFLPSHRCS